MTFWIPFILGALVCVLSGDAHPRAFAAGFLVVVAAGIFGETR